MVFFTVLSQSLENKLFVPHSVRVGSLLVMLQLAAGPCPCLYAIQHLQLLSPLGWPTPISVPGRAIFTARASMWQYLGQASQVVVREPEFWFAQADLVVRTAKLTGSLMKFDYCLSPSLLPRSSPPPANLRAASAPG
jgi:hypothetical protein